MSHHLSQGSVKKMCGVCVCACTYTYTHTNAERDRERMRKKVNIAKCYQLVNLGKVYMNNYCNTLATFPNIWKFFNQNK